MNNKPMRMEVVSVVGDVGITLFFVGTETAMGTWKSFIVHSSSVKVPHV